MGRRDLSDFGWGGEGEITLPRRTVRNSRHILHGYHQLSYLQDSSIYIHDLLIRSKDFGGHGM